MRGGHGQIDGRLRGWGLTEVKGHGMRQIREARFRGMKERQSFVAREIMLMDCRL